MEAAQAALAALDSAVEGLGVPRPADVEMAAEGAGEGAEGARQPTLRPNGRKRKVAVFLAYDGADFAVRALLRFSQPLAPPASNRLRQLRLQGTPQRLGGAPPCTPLARRACSSTPGCRQSRARWRRPW